MAVRSGAGTGVVVSLVVFVLTTVFLLVLTIVFYAGKSKEIEERTKAEQALEKFAGKQRNTDGIKSIEAAAGNQPIVPYMAGRMDATMAYLGAGPQATLDSVKAEFAGLGVPKDGGVVRESLVALNRDLKTSKNEIDALKNQVKDVNDQMTQKQAEIAQLNADHQKSLDEVNGRIESYRVAGSEFKTKLEAAIVELEKAKDTLRNNYETRIKDLQDEVDNQGKELVTLKSRVADYETRAAQTRLKASDPAAMVDGEVIDAPGVNDEVFINRGKKDHVVLGMTFEVYSEKNSIRQNPNTGEFFRGKASLEVKKVNDTTSVCKITRSVPGQPVVRGDVIANAIYDPKYNFKFLIHGKFDTDGDNKPSETEAEYLRGLVLDWGGTVVTGEDIPGDLDFLVLGVEPPNPPPPAANASEVLVNDYIRKRSAYETYQLLYRHAREAQIPC
jgi:hypothetical protein